MNFVTNKEVESYWVASGTNEFGLEEVCQKPIVKDIVLKLLRGEDVRANVINFNARSFKSFFEDFNDSKKKVISCDPLLYYYLQSGYLSAFKKDKDKVS